MLLIRKIENEEERKKIRKICNSVNNPTVKSFPNMWERFKNWEKNPPWIAILNGLVVGFMGFTINKNEYINFYDFAVLPEFQRKGIGMALWDKVLKIAKENGKTRIKCSAHKDYPGFNFYTEKLNWKPFTRKNNEYKFDANIKNINNIDEFISKKKEPKTLIQKGNLLRYVGKKRLK